MLWLAGNAVVSREVEITSSATIQPELTAKPKNGFSTLFEEREGKRRKGKCLKGQ